MGTIYYARVVSLRAKIRPLRPSARTRPFRVACGYIRACHHKVDNSVATIEQAQALGTNTNDTIAAYITSAQIR